MGYDIGQTAAQTPLQKYWAICHSSSIRRRARPTDGLKVTEGFTAFVEKRTPSWPPTSRAPRDAC